MFEIGFDTARAWLIDQGITATLATVLLRVGLGLLVLFVSWLTGVVARRILRRIIARLIV